MGVRGCVGVCGCVYVVVGMWVWVYGCGYVNVVMFICRCGCEYVGVNICRCEYVDICFYFFLDNMPSSSTLPEIS